MDDAQIREAAEAISQVIGASAYLHAAGYPLEKFLKELHAAVDYVKSQQKP